MKIGKVEILARDNEYKLEFYVSSETTEEKTIRFEPVDSLMVVPERIMNEILYKLQEDYTCDELDDFDDVALVIELIKKLIKGEVYV